MLSDCIAVRFSTLHAFEFLKKFMTLTNCSSTSKKCFENISVVLMTHAIDEATVRNLIASFCCVLGKDTLLHLSLLEGTKKQL